MKDYGHLLRRPGGPSARRRSRPRCATCTSCWPSTSRAPSATRSPLTRRLPRRLPPRPRPGRARRSRASCCAAIPGLELVEPAEWELCCGSAGHLQPDAARGRRPSSARARPRTCAPPAPRRSPPPTRAARCRSPRTCERRADLPPDDPARPLDPREPTRERCEHRPDPRRARSHEILSDDALAFVGELHGRFGARRAASCCRPRARARRRRRASWRRRARSARATGRSPPPRADYEDRRVEITGPTDRKLVINALNSGAKGFMADFEDANSPDLAQPGRGPREPDRRDRGHDHLRRRRRQALRARSTTRRRCWCARAAGTCPRSTCTIDGEPVAGALMDFGLYAFHNAPARCTTRGLGLYLYLPKMEHHLEARLWNDVFDVHRGRARRADAARSAPPC